jgi:hypothetical protein
VPASSGVRSVSTSVAVLMRSTERAPVDFAMAGQGPVGYPGVAGRWYYLLIGYEMKGRMRWKES